MLEQIFSPITSNYMSSRIETWATTIMAVIAVAVGVKVLSPTKSGVRQVSTFQGSPTLLPIGDSGHVREFALAVDRNNKRQSNSVALLEFFDVECPFCANYAVVLDSARTILGDTLAVFFAHMPLRNHRFAKSGAIAVECAHQHGIVASYIREVYKQQDSLGIRSWAKIGQDAGLVDTIAFESCRAKSVVAARIDSAKAAATALKIPGTPTIWVNDWQYSTPPDLETLLRDIRRMAARAGSRQ
jgi:protein-disulfide isomerase